MNEIRAANEEFTNASATSETTSGSLLASYMLSFKIAKEMKSYSEGPFIKDCLLTAAQCFENQDMVAKFNSIPLSRHTTVRRIEEINVFLERKLKISLQNAKYFSLSLDESTDICDIAQLVVMGRYVNSNFDIEEEFLDLASLHGTTRATDIYNSIETIIDQYGQRNKLIGICTDGAATMVGSDKGLVGQFRRKGFAITNLHCTIHQESLCAKICNIPETMSTVVKVVNKIRGGHNALNHRRFKKLLGELNAEYSDLVMFTEVRWLSRGNYRI